MRLWRGGRRSGEPADRLSGWLTASNAGLAGLALVTVALVIQALGTTPVPRSSGLSSAVGPSPSASALLSRPTPLSSAPSASTSLAGSTITARLGGRGTVLWRWIGSASCPATTPGHLSRSTDSGRTWQDGDLAAPIVTALDAASASRVVVSTLDAACGPTLLSTEDGGATWETLDGSVALQAISLGGLSGAWAITGGEVVRQTDGPFVPLSPPSEIA